MEKDKPIGILDRPIGKPKFDVALSSFSYLFSELVQYCQAKADSTQQMEKELADAGYGIGTRVLELTFFREKQGKWDRHIITLLQFLHSTVWKYLFGKPADGLERSTDRQDEFYLYDKDPITNRFVSVPANLGQFNTAAFIAGIINGFLDGAEFQCTVTACFSSSGGTVRTVYVVRFGEDVLRREAELTNPV